MTKEERKAAAEAKKTEIAEKKVRPFKSDQTI